ncbi:MAG: hypothetical protein JXR05_00660 [Flavobacteriaceae bacterium]
MKIKNLLFLVVCCVFLSSCFVKSLHPFYTKDTISFNESLIGSWKDKEKGEWIIKSFKEEMFKEQTTTENINGIDVKTTIKMEEPKPSSDDFKFYQKFKESYYVSYKKKEKESVFIAMPFVLKNQLFLDFTPLFVDSEDLSSLTENHLVPTHSLVKIDILDNGEISMKWLDESKLKELFKKNKIKIKHEKTGVAGDDILLTATTKELQKFIKKFMASKDEDKWSSDTNFILNKTDVQP